MTKIHGNGTATEFVPRNFFSIWVLANDKQAQFRDKVKCQLLHDPTPFLSFSTPEPSGIFGRREESSEIDKTTLFACIKIRDLNLFSPPQLPFLFLLYSSTVYFYKIYFPQVANKNKALGD